MRDKFPGEHIHITEGPVIPVHIIALVSHRIDVDHILESCAFQGRYTVTGVQPVSVPGILVVSVSVKHIDHRIPPVVVFKIVFWQKDGITDVRVKDCAGKDKVPLIAVGISVRLFVLAVLSLSLILSLLLLLVILLHRLR